MNIQNLTSNPSLSLTNNGKKNTLIVFLIVIIALTSGFWLSRFFPFSKQSSSALFTSGDSQSLSADNISHPDQLKIGQWYGNVNGQFKDSAIGTIAAGGVNGEGTHTLIRPGGDDQKAALTSSVLDLDLFIDKKVEIKGETNISPKAGWFLDVGSIKIIE